MPATPSVTYAYGASSTNNNNGRLLTAGNSNETDTYAYDSLGRVTQVSRLIGTNAYNLTYGYNTASQVTSLIYPSGRILTNFYDAIGRTTQIGDTARNYLGASPPTYNAGRVAHPTVLSANETVGAPPEPVLLGWEADLSWVCLSPADPKRSINGNHSPFAESIMPKA